MSKLKVLDLFSGIGGFSLGLERTGGFETIAFCEINNFCQRVLRKHWPKVFIHSDITKLGAQHFVGYSKPDLICGGFPCQDISVAGKQVGLSGERSGLWWEMHRVIRELRPRWVLVENVPNLRTKGADEVLASLEEEGYTCWPTVVGAWAAGAPHNRERVWILAYAGQKLWGTRGNNSSRFTSKWNEKTNHDQRCSISRQLLGNSQHNGSSTSPLSRSTGATISNHSEGQNKTSESEGASSSSVLADASSERLEGEWIRTGGSQSEQSESSSGYVSQWPAFQGQPQHAWEAPRRVEPRLGRTVDGLSGRLDKHRLMALGNTVVPQIPELFGHFILQVEAALQQGT